jgi:toxin ParE1/3/4
VTLQKTDFQSITISAHATEDLLNILDFISAQNEIAANKIIKELQNQFILLRDNPRIGRERNNYLVGLRSFVFKNYFIFYITRDGGIDILRILHGARDIERIFERFFDSLSDS